MSTEVIPFDYAGNPIRVLTDEQGEPWFVAKDVCDVLGLTWSGNRISNVPAEWRGMTSVVTRHQNQHGTWIDQEVEVSTLSEPGLYFFINRSDSPIALPFQRWVAGVVLPRIRKTGGYIQGEESMNEDELVLRAMQVLQKKVETLRATIEAQQPKVEAFDQLMDSKALYNFRNAARILGIPERTFITMLRRDKYLTHEGGNTPYVRHRKTGLFIVRVYINTWNLHGGSQTLITARGLEHGQFCFSVLTEVRL